MRTKMLPCLAIALLGTSTYANHFDIMFAGDGLAGGGPILEAPKTPCITDAERARVRAEIDAYHIKHGIWREFEDADAAKYPQIPIGGNAGKDVFINNYTDLDPGSGIRDFENTDITYNGHQGHDIDIRTFGEQEFGVPIFAALDGIVVSRRDGEYDRNTSGQNQTANYVILHHGGSHYTYYWHMKRGSVKVAVGQSVRVGTELGSVASSGSSTGPHLHFESWNNGSWFEPCAGIGRSGPSGWVNQHPVLRSMLVRDFNFTPYDLSQYAGLPNDLPREGGTSPSRSTGWWTDIKNLPAFSTWRVRIFNPNNNLHFDSGTGNFNNTSAYRNSWWYWRYNLNYSALGTYRIEFSLNNAVAVTLTYEVNSNLHDLENSAPNGVTAKYDGSPLNLDAPLYCRIDSTLINDDPDCDTVRYRYQWTVGGEIARDVTHAGRADALPAGAWLVQQPIICRITPTDGQLDGPTTLLKFPGKL